MGNYTQMFNNIFDSTMQYSPLNGNYQHDHKFINSLGFTSVDITMSQKITHSNFKTNEDRFYIKDKKLYAYRIIQGDLAQLKTEIIFYNDLYLDSKNRNKKINTNSKIGTVQFFSLIPSETQIKELVHKISKIKKSTQPFSSIFNNKVKAKLVLLLQCSAITLDSLFGQSFLNVSNITTNNVQFLQIFGQLIQMLSQFKSKGISLASINPSQVYVQLNNFSQEQNKFSLKRLFYHPSVFHNQKKMKLTYFSPEQFQEQKNIQQKSNLKQENQNDLVFSLGLVLLSILIKKICYDCYNFNSKQFCRSLLQQRIDILQKTLLNLRQTKLKKQLFAYNCQMSDYFNGSFEYILFSMVSQMLAKKEYRTITTINEVKMMYHQLTRSIYPLNFNTKQTISKSSNERSLIQNLKYKTEVNEQTALTQSVIVKKNIKKLKTVKRILTQGKQNQGKFINQQKIGSIQLFKAFEQQNHEIKTQQKQTQSKFNIKNQIQSDDLFRSVIWHDQNGNIIQPIKCMQS